MAQTRIKI